MAIPEIDELKSIVAGLLRSTQTLADQATTSHDCHSTPTTCRSCPDKISLPRLGSHSHTDVFALQRHLLALETYFCNALLHWSPGLTEQAWKISVVNTLISQLGGHFTMWLELHGKHVENWDALVAEPELILPVNSAASSAANSVTSLPTAQSARNPWQSLL